MNANYCSRCGVKRPDMEEMREGLSDALESLFQDRLIYLRVKQHRKDCIGGKKHIG
jgi:hypothetical protein